MDKTKKFYSILGWIAIAYFIVFFFCPILKTLITSISNNGRISIDSYIEILKNKVYLVTLVRTLYIASISTIITLIIGYIMAFFIVNRPAEKQTFWIMIVIAPMFMSLTIRLFGWMILLSNEGPLVSFIEKMLNHQGGVTLLFSYSAVIIGIVHYSLPFVVLSIYTSLSKLEPSVIEASKMLGASSIITFLKVIFPLSLPGVFSAASLSYAISASTFLVPIMLGGPKNNLLSNLAYNTITTVGDFKLGATISLVLLFIVAIVLMIISLLERRFCVE